jgi:hypothetical protein
MRLKELIDRGLYATRELWPEIRKAFGWVHKVALILGERTPVKMARQKLGGLLGAMKRQQPEADELSGAMKHFMKVTKSYWPGLFAHRLVPGMPRTNNALEQAFGSHRYHERRATGRKGASPALVLRGAAKLVAGLATRQGEVSADDLAGANREEWRKLRSELEQRRQRRVERWRFRRDPDQYLRDLEDKLDQSRLPS